MENTKPYIPDPTEDYKHPLEGLEGLKGINKPISLEDENQVQAEVDRHLREDFNSPTDVSKMGKLSFEEYDKLYKAGIITPARGLTAEEAAIEYFDTDFAERKFVHSGDIGKSMYDEPIYTRMSLDNANDLRAIKQPWYAKVAAGFGKAAVLTGTTAVDGSVGLLVGGVEAIKNNDFSYFFNNEVTRAMEAINEWSREEMPTYTTEDYQQNPLALRNIFTANFLSEMIEQTGFIAGSVVGTKGLGLINKLPSLLKKGKTLTNLLHSGLRKGAKGSIKAYSKAKAAVTRSPKNTVLLGAGDEVLTEGSTTSFSKYRKLINLDKKVSDFTSTMVGSALAAANEASIESLSSYNDFKEKNEKAIWQDYFDKKKILDEAFSKGLLDENAYKDRLGMLQKNKDKNLAFTEQDARKVGKSVWSANIGILTLSNYFLLGPLFTSGFRTSKGIASRVKSNLEKGESIGKRVSATAKSAGKKAEAAAGKAAVKPVEYRTTTWLGTKRPNKRLVGTLKGISGIFTEGAEEGAQSIISKASQDYWQGELDAYLKSTNNTESVEAVLDWTDSYLEAAKQSFGEDEFWKETIMGGLMGLIGIPGARRWKGFKNANGKWQNPVDFKRFFNFQAEYRDYVEQRNREDELIKAVNERLNDPTLLEYYRGVAAHNYLEEEMVKAAINDDEKKFKDSRYMQLVKDIAMFDNIGRLDDFLEVVREAFDTSDEALRTLTEVTTSTDKEGRSSGPYVTASGTPIMDIPEYEATINGQKVTMSGKDYMISELRKSRERTLTTISDYIKTRDDIDSATGYALDEDSLTLLTWMKMQQGNWTERIKGIHKEKISPISQRFINAINEEIEFEQKEIQDREKKLEEKRAELNKLEKEKEASKTSESDYKNILSKITEVKKEIEDIQKFIKDVKPSLDTISKNKENFEKVFVYKEKTEDGKTESNENDFIAKLSTLKDEDLDAILDFFEGLTLLTDWNRNIRSEQLQDTSYMEQYKKDVKDAVDMARGILYLATKFSIYMRNPALINVEKENTVKKQEEEEIKKENDTIEKEISKVKSVQELRKLLDSVPVVPEHIREILFKLSEEGNAVVKEYFKIENTKRKLLNKLYKLEGFNKEVLAKAEKLITSVYNSAERFEDINFDKQLSSEALLDETKSDEENITFVSEVSYAIYSVINEVHKDDAFVESFKKTKYYSFKEKGTSTQGDADTSSDDTEVSVTTYPKTPSSNSTPVSPKSPTEVQKEVVDNNSASNLGTEDSNTKREEDNKNKKEEYYPAIREISASASANKKDFRYFKDVIKEEGLNFDKIWDYLNDAGAFKYLDSGKLKPNTRVGFMVDPAYEENKDTFGENETLTVFLVDLDNDNQVIGNLYTSPLKQSEYIGQKGLIERITKEYSERQNKEGKFISSLESKVANLYNGQIPLIKETDSDRKVIKSLALSKEGILNPSNGLIFAIGKGGNNYDFGKGLPSNIESKSIKINNIQGGNTAGAVYVLIPNATGYTPMRLYTAHFNKGEYDLVNNEDLLETKVGQEIESIFRTLVSKIVEFSGNIESESFQENLIDKEALEKYINSFLNSSGIREFLGIPKNYAMTYDKDNNCIYIDRVVKEQGEVRYIKSERSVISLAATETREPSEHLKAQLGALAEVETVVTMKTEQELYNNIVSAFQRYNFPLQISLNLLNLKRSENPEASMTIDDIIDSSLLFSNINFHRSVLPLGVSFSIRAIDPNTWKILESTSPVKKITATLGSNELYEVGNIKGIPVSLEENRIIDKPFTFSYVVDLESKTIYNTEGEEAVINSDETRQLILDLAWAYSVYGDNYTGDAYNMYKGNCITPDGRVLNRTTRSYLAGKDAEKVKAQINNKNLEALLNPITALIEQTKKEIDLSEFEINKKYKTDPNTKLKKEFYYRIRLKKDVNADYVDILIRKDSKGNKSVVININYNDEYLKNNNDNIKKIQALLNKIIPFDVPILFSRSEKNTEVVNNTLNVLQTINKSKHGVYYTKEDNGPLIKIKNKEENELGFLGQESDDSTDIDNGNSSVQTIKDKDKINDFIKNKEKEGYIIERPTSGLLGEYLTNNPKIQIDYIEEILELEDGTYIIKAKFKNPNNTPLLDNLFNLKLVQTKGESEVENKTSETVLYPIDPKNNPAKNKAVQKVLELLADGTINQDIINKYFEKYSFESDRNYYNRMQDLMSVIIGFVYSKNIKSQKIPEFKIEELPEFGLLVRIPIDILEKGLKEAIPKAVDYLAYKSNLPETSKSMLKERLDTYSSLINAKKDDILDFFREKQRLLGNVKKSIDTIEEDSTVTGEEDNITYREAQSDTNYEEAIKKLRNKYSKDSSKLKLIQMLEEEVISNKEANIVTDNQGNKVVIPFYQYFKSLLGIDLNGIDTNNVVKTEDGIIVLNTADGKPVPLNLKYRSQSYTAAQSGIKTYPEDSLFDLIEYVEDSDIFLQIDRNKKTDFFTEYEKLSRLSKQKKSLRAVGSTKKIRELLKKNEISPEITNLIIKAIEENPSLKNLSPLDIFTSIVQLKNEDLLKVFHENYAKQVNEGLESLLIPILEKYNISVKEVDMSRFGGALGAFDILNKVIYLANTDLRNATTFPEEFAHAFVELMGTPRKSNKNAIENRDFKFLMDNVENTAIYRETFEQYKDIYKDKDGSPDLYKIKKEAIGKALAAGILNNFEAKANAESSFWEKLKEWFQAIINNFKNVEYVSFEDLIDKISKEILNGDTSRLDKVDASNYKILDYAETLANQEKQDGILPENSNTNKEVLLSYMSLGYDSDTIASMMNIDKENVLGEKMYYWDSLTKEQRIDRINRLQKLGLNPYDISEFELSTPSSIEELISLIQQDSFYTNSNADRRVIRIMNNIFNISKSLGITYSFRESQDVDSNGKPNLISHYNPANNNIAFHVSPLSDKFGSIAMHELIYSILSAALSPNNYYKLTQFQKEAIEELDKVYNEVINTLNETPIIELYGISDIKDFIAKLSNPYFRDILKNISVQNKDNAKKESLWKRVVEAIKNFIKTGSYDGRESLLDKADSALENLLEDPVRIDSSYNNFNSYVDKNKLEVVDTSELPLTEKDKIREKISFLPQEDLAKGLYVYKDDTTGYEYHIALTNTPFSNIPVYNILGRKFKTENLSEDLQKMLKQKGFTKNNSIREIQKALNCFLYF